MIAASPRPSLARYEDSVFINCPFDERYAPLFEVVVFAVLDAGFSPRCALEHDDGAQNRFEKIVSLIEGSRFGIHDLSRTEPSGGGLPRFNMPLELGLFLGCKRFGSPRDRQKQCLILDVDRYRFQRFISDIAGQDVHDHGAEPERAVREVRNWLKTASRRSGIPAASAIWRRYQRFKADLPELSRELGVDADDLTFVDRTEVIGHWLSVNAPRG